MDIRIVALYIAGGTGAAGLLLLLCIALVQRFRFVYTGSFVAWCLLALAIVLSLFALFPSNSVSGTFEGLKVGGAIAAFLVVVTWLARQGLIVIDKDRQVEQYETQIESLQHQLEVAPTQAGQSTPPLSGAMRYRYRTDGKPRRTIGLIAGNLAEVRQVDVWVNSENTNMQMASYYDRSISGVIRYYGSRRNRGGDVEADLIGNGLREEVGDAQTVAPGSVYATGPGELSGWGVKRIMHVAAVQGEAGHGYRAVQNIGGCVSRVLQRIDEENHEGGEVLRSVVFPLLGTGQARGDVEQIFPALLRAVLTHIRTHVTQITEVWFVTYTRPELALCRQVLNREDGVTAVGDTHSTPRSLW